MKKVQYFFNTDINPSEAQEYKKAIGCDLERFEEIPVESTPEKFIVYLDYGLTGEWFEHAKTLAVTTQTPLLYRRLGLVSPKYTNQWREWPGCPGCGNMMGQLKFNDPRYQCKNCAIETSFESSTQFAPLDLGSSIKNLHYGEKCVIIGGGKSFPQNWDTLKEKYPNIISIGINMHASKYKDICDYILFNDQHTWEYVKDFQGKKISRFPVWNDIHLPLLAPGVLSGILACQVAQEMGFIEIILCGFDCNAEYGVEAPKRLDRENEKLSWHLEKWKPHFKKEDSKKNIYTLEGPLKAIFPVYQFSE